MIKFWCLSFGASVMKGLSENFAHLKLPLSISSADCFHFLKYLSRFRIAFKTSISKHGLVLDFTLEVFTGSTKSTTAKNFVTKF